ncbi:MAG: cbb3-type cytochrome oxidase assembly protein CcoS [Magnetococcales bacterium]|nr:cbb3-type cytochrome oxidase assembly protein CcoS [Magnetococcales bacterium]
MDTLYLLIPLALFLGVVGLGLLVWAIKGGQFEDLEGPRHRILFDDDEEMIPPNPKKKPPT